MTPEDFRRIGHELIDRIADFRAGIAERPVMAQVSPGDLRRALPAQAPETPEPFESIFRDLDALILPGISHFQSPRFFGYFPANSELSSVLGDYLSTGLGALGLSWQAAPALAELEETVTDWMRQLLGLSDGWSGVIQDTASTSTLLALLCARERASDYSLARGGLQGAQKPLVVYVSAHAHSSVDKAALLAGFGRDNIRLVESDAAFAMRPEALEAAIVADLAPQMVSVNKKVPVNNVAELIAYAKANAGKIDYAVDATTGAGVISGRLLNRRGEMKMSEVSYKSAPQMAQDVAAGQVPVLVSSIAASKVFLDSGDIRPLAVFSSRRFPGLPNLPIVAVSLPGVMLDGFFVIVAPAGTPADIVERFNKAVAQFLKTPEAPQRLNAMGLATSGAGTPASTAEFIRVEQKRWRDLAVELAIEAQ